MLHSVHQQVFSFVCLLFGSVQWAFLLGNDIDENNESEQNSKVTEQKTKTMSWKSLKHSAELRGTADFIT